MKKQNLFKALGLIFVVFVLNFSSAVSIKNVVSNPSEIAPGETFDISMKIENILDEDVFSLNIGLNLENIPFAPYQSSTEDSLEELQKGDSENFNFKLIALPNAESGVYKIPVEMDYETGDGNASSKSGLISVIINSKPEITISSEKNILIRGREGELPIRIVNSGLSDIKFVYLKTSEVIGLRFLTEPIQYLGDIDSDDFDSFGYSVQVSENAPSTINLPVRISFKDSTNKEFTKNFNLILRTYSLKEAQELGLVKKTSSVPYLGGGALILLYIVYRISKKRKRKNRR